MSGMDSFDGWAVSVQTDPNVISPLNDSFAGNNLFVANYSTVPLSLSDCVNGNGNGCTGSDGPGVASSAGTYPFGTPPPVLGPGDAINGTLFTITYKVIASGFSRVEIVQSSSTFSYSYGSQYHPVSYLTLPGIYGTQPPDFTVSASPTKLVVLQGSNVTTTITVDSVAGFQGTLNLTASNLNFTSGTVNFIAFRAIFGQRTLHLTPDGSNNTLLTLLTSVKAPAYDYPKITITAFNNTVLRSVFLDVNVETYSDISVSVSPSTLHIHAGTSANGTVSVQSVNGFFGNVSLTLNIPVNVTAVLGSAKLFVPVNGMSETSLNVTIPVLALPFTYRIDVLARASYSTPGGTFQLFHNQSMFILPPPPSLLVAINPARLTLRAGLTGTFTITVTSVDYAWQYLYLSATMSGGEANLSNDTYYMPLPNTQYGNISESVNFTLTVQIPADQVSGPFGVILTVYQNSPKASQNAPTQTLVIPVTVTSLYHASTNPRILGQSPSIYFEVLGALVIPFIILSIYSYRKAREDKDDDWKA